MHERTSDFLNSVLGADDPQHCICAFQKLINQLGYEFMIVSGLPSYDDNPRALVALDAWPTGWLDRFEQEKYFLDDPVCRMASQSSRPFLWSEARASCERTAKRRTIEAEAIEYGLRDGFVMPFASKTNWQTVVSIASRDRIELDLESQGDLYLASAFLCSALDVLMEGSQRRITLSAREQEVLQWAAHGKTVWETGRILSISEKTVEHHMARIRGKLGASTVAHAVAKGLSGKFINMH